VDASNDNAGPTVLPPTGVVRVLSECGFLIAVACFAWHFGRLHVARPEFWLASFERAVDGTAITPYQYRTLFPWIVSWIVDLGINLPFVESVRGYALIIEVVGLVLLGYTFRYYLQQFLGRTPAATWLSLTIFWILPFNYLLPKWGPWYYVYDIPSVLFFTLGLIFLKRGFWLGFYPLFIVATFNRETTCFLTVILLLTGCCKLPWRRLLPHLVAQLVLWLAIKWMIQEAYVANKGGTFFNVMADNWAVLSGKPAAYPLLFSSLGFTWIPVLLAWRWIPDTFARRACLVAPIFFAGMMCVGVIDEIRIYGELIPVVLPAFLLLVLGRVAGAPAAPTTAT